MSVKGRDGEEYEFVRVDKRNESEPQMTRYTVRRVRDGAIIHNFPDYLLDFEKESG